MEMTIDLGTFTAILYALVGVMLIIVLYHILFIVVDARKIVRRFEDMTSQVETVMLKPLAIADQAFQWLMDYVEHWHKNRPAKHHHRKRDDKVVDAE